MLHALSMQQLDGVGLFGTMGLCLPDSHRAAALHLCNCGGTVGFGLSDTSGMLSFCFTNESHLMGLGFPDGRGTKGLCLLNGLSGL